MRRLMLVPMLVLATGLALPASGPAKERITRLRVCGPSACRVLTSPRAISAFLSAITNAAPGRPAPAPAAYFTLRPERTQEWPTTWPRYLYLPAARMVRVQIDRTPEWRWLGRRDPLVRKLTRGLAPYPAPKQWHGFVHVTLFGRSIALRYPSGPSISFTYPANWHVTRYRLDNVLDPKTVFAVTSYRPPQGPPDDCPGSRARGRPADGAFLLVQEELDGASLKRSLPRLSPRPHHFSLPAHEAAGCLPRASRLYQFRVARRAFYVWVSLGPRTSPTTRAAVATLLDGMWIAAYRA
jgi:hypothetical protein